jgi:muramidase (phage lysozyme)
MTSYDNTLKNQNVQAFLALIRHTEGAGYSTLFGGEHFTEFEDHPRRLITRTLGGKPITSTAAGAYQFLSRTWDECKKALGLPDFSPPSQDRAALYLIERRRALPAVLEGDWPTALERCNREWASLPGSPYGQPTKSLNTCLAFLDNMTGDSLQADPFPEIVIPSPTGETDMAPFILAAIPSLVQAAPALIRLFGKGEQSEKNAATAEAVAHIAKEITGQPTVEGAVNALSESPEVATKFSEAVEANWFALTGEAGGGGIEGARKADKVARETGKPWLSPALWISCGLLPLVYIVVVAVMFGEGWTNDVRAMVVSSIISLVLGSITGFFLGTSYGSQKKTEMLADRA